MYLRHNLELANANSRLAKAWKVIRPNGREWLVLLLYAGAFHFTHTLAALWGGAGFYSLWFPPAGLRFALLWTFGPRLTIAVTVVELVVQLLAGILDLSDRDWPTMAISIARPALAYGLAIAAVLALTRNPRSAWSTPPMPFGMAAVLAPLAAALAALPWSIMRPDFTGVANTREIISSLSTFAIGDLLGVLLLAPPLIFLADVRSGADRWSKEWPSWGSILEFVLVLGTAGLFVWTLARLDIVETLTPVLLAACWIGLRFGRLAAWFTNVLVAVAAFPLTSGSVDVDSKLAVHMSVAAVAIAGYLAGSFAIAADRAREEIARRDRLLRHADRLKTLRAMSVAIIHEVSQPLSTLLLETRHLRTLAQRTQNEDLIETASLVERKTEALALMTQRLREFGSRGEQNETTVLLSESLQQAADVVASEFTTRGVALAIAPPEERVVVHAAPIELAQALVNVLRNALQASGRGKSVHVTCDAEGETASICVLNSVDIPPSANGMGVGMIIARSIVEAFGGSIVQARTPSGEMKTQFTLIKEKAS